MDYNGQSDPMDFPPMYYPGYYDENGMLVIRKCQRLSRTNLNPQLTSRFT